MKRKLSLILVFVLIMGVVSSAAFAAGSMMNILPSIASNPDWKYVDIFYDGYASVEFHDGTRGYINPYGEFSQEKPAEAYDMSGFTSYEDPRLVIMGDEYFFVDREGRILLQALEEANVFSGGVAAAKRDGVWYIVDANTLMQNAQLYDEAYERVLGNDFLDRAGIERADIVRIHFEGSTAGANDTSWDASAEGNGRVMAYVENGNELHIASDGGVVADIDLSGLFAGYVNLEEINYNGCFDTSETQYVAGMFEGCAKLSDEALRLNELDLSRVRDIDQIRGAAEPAEPETPTEPPVTEAPVTAPPVTEPPVSYGEGGTLMAETVEGKPYDAQNVFHTGIAKSSIKRIEFYDKLNAIAGDYVFDVSEEQNGSVMAAVEDGVLRIGANGPIYAPGNSNYLFSEYTNVESIEFNGCLDTSGAQTMVWMFEGCRKLKSLDLSGFDTSNVSDMSYMFCGCTKIKHLNLFFFNTANVRNMESMFASCADIEELDLSGFNTANVENMRNMFSSCRKLKELTLGEGFDVSSVSDHEGMFDDCPKINHSWESISGGAGSAPLGPGGTLMPKSAEPITFSSDEIVYTSGVPKDNISRIVFHSSLEIFGDDSMDVSEEQNRSVLAMIEGDVLHIGADGIVRAPKDSSKLFKDYANVYSFEFNGCFDTSGAEDMTEMFARCSSLSQLDLGIFDTACVRDMASMFMGCTSLKDLNLRSFNTARVEDMGSMFSGCASIERLDLSSFVTGRLKSMVYMFNGCAELVDLDVSNFDVSGVTNNYEVFAGCAKLNMTWEELAGRSSASSSGTKKAPEPQKEAEAAPSYMGGALMCDEVELDSEGSIPIDQQFVYNTNVMKRDVTEIVFHDNFAALGENAFDASENQDGSVLAWMDGSVLNIAADGPVYAPADSTYLFAGYINAYTIRFNGCFDTSRVENMRSMFDCSHGLQELDLSGFDTSNVRDMTGMFGDCQNLQSLDLSCFDTSNVEYMSWMFYNCFNLCDLNVSSFNTGRVMEMRSMFLNCHGLQTLDLSSFTADSLADMSGMFESCENLSNLDLTNFHVDGSVNQEGAFDGCEKLDIPWEATQTTPAGGYLMAEQVEESTGEPQYIFDTGVPKAGITRIEIISELDAVAGDIYDVSLHKDGSVLAGIDGSLLHIGANGKVIAPKNCFALFGEYPDLEEINFNGCFDTSEAVDMLCMFDGNDSLRYIDLSFFNTQNVTNMESMFQACYSLESINLSGFDTSKVGSMNHMFHNCHNLRELDLSSFTAESVYDMRRMFGNCSNLEFIDFSSISVNDSILHDEMFYGCDKLNMAWEDLPGAGQGGEIGLLTNEDADLISGADYIFGHPEYKRADIKHIRVVNSLDGFDENDMDVSESKNGSVRAKIEDGVMTIGADGAIRAPENCAWLFSGYPNLEIIELDSTFDTSGVTDMTEMFSNNPRLREVEVGNFNTSEVTSMANMFSGCKALEHISVYYFETGNVESMYGMFYDCDSLREVDISNFDLSSAADMSYMFGSCDKLENVNTGDARPGDGCLLYGFFDDYAYMGVTWNDLFGDGGANPFANVYLTIGSSGEEVKLVQRCLIDMGYLTGTVDGQYGNMTSNAVRVYQQVNSYAQTGAVDGALYMEFYKIANPLVVTPLSERQNMFDIESRELLERAYQEVITVEDIGNLPSDTNATGIGTEINAVLADMGSKLTHSDLIISELFEVSLYGHYLDYLNDGDNSIHVTLPAGMAQGATLVVLVSSDDAGWNVLPAENVIIDANGSVTLRLHELGAVAFAVPGGIIESANAPADAGTRVMRRADVDSEYAFGTDIRKEEVISIVFADTTDAVSGTVYDVSEARDGSVTAIFTREGAMYIGAEGSVIAPESCRNLFEDFRNLTSISFNGNFDTSATADMTQMFSDCENLIQADFNTLNTENVCYMAGMFQRTSLEEYDLSAFDTRNVEDMCAMFIGCNDAKYINVSSFDTSKVRDMSSMFDGCTNLSSVELGDGWDTGNVSDFAYMFANCTALTELDIENFEFHSLETMEGILDNCPNYRYSTELLFVMVASGEIGFGLNDGAAEVVQSVEEESIYLYQGCGDRENVVAIQQKLIEMGYLNDVADGVFGGNTRRAVEAFQQVYGLPVTGEVDNELYHRILGADSDDETEAVYEEVSGSAEMPGGYGATGTFTLLVPSMDNLYYLTIIEGVEHAAAEYGFEFEVISCNYDAEVQLMHLELQLAVGTEALFLCPADDEVRFVAEGVAAELGVPLFIFDTEADSEGTFSLLHDEFRGGYICGEEYAKDHPDGGKVALVAASSSFEERESGFSQAVADSGVNIEEMKMALESNSAEECALSLIELLLNVDDVSAIFCRGELEAQAAVRACEITGKQIPIYAVGGSEDMKTLVEQGKIDTIAAQSPLAMGRIAVDLYSSWLHGENYAGNHYIDFLMINSETLGNYGVAGWQ